MRLAFFAAVSAAVLAVSGAAFAGSVENTFNNTLTITDAGVTTRWHVNQDGTYTMFTPDNQSVSGTWRQAPEQICATPAGGAETCFPLVEGKAAGDTWQQPGPNGQSITVSIQPGR